MSRAIPTAPPSPTPEASLAHFTSHLTFETDCADVHAAAGDRDYVLVDVRAPELYRRGHVPGAINIPHREITEDALAGHPPDAEFVVYCAGPHCNAAHRGAARLAALGRVVREMIGGVTGWQQEGFALERTPE